MWRFVSVFLFTCLSEFFIKGVIDITYGSCGYASSDFYMCIPTLTTRTCSNRVYAICTTVLFCRQVDGELSPHLQSLDWTRWRKALEQRHPEGVRLNFYWQRHGAICTQGFLPIFPIIAKAVGIEWYFSRPCSWCIWPSITSREEAEKPVGERVVGVMLTPTKTGAHFTVHAHPACFVFHIGDNSSTFVWLFHFVQHIVSKAKVTNTSELYCTHVVVKRLSVLPRTRINFPIVTIFIRLSQF